MNHETNVFELFENIPLIDDGAVDDADDVSESVDGEAVDGEDSVDAGDFLHDAELLGEKTPAYEELMAQEATLLAGRLYGQRDYRNTQDGGWNAVSAPWHDWVFGGEREGNNPAWGFSRHTASKSKEGSCIVLGSSVGQSRKAKAMDEMYAMGLDIDSGASLDDVIDRLVEKRICCFVYTSYNHNKAGIELKRDEVLRKLQISSDPSLAQVKEYLSKHGKDRYEESFIDQIEIADPKLQRPEGVKIVLDTPPLEKFRLIFPLAEPVKLIDLAETQEKALSIWEDAITGLAVNELGVSFDTSCTDPSRLFYTARHPKGRRDWDCVIVRGDPLKFDEIKRHSKAAYTKNRSTDPFLLAASGSGQDADRPPNCFAPSGMSLNQWHSRVGKHRFMLADVLEHYCDDKIRRSGGEASGHVHIECPFEHEHSSEGGTACMAINALDASNEYWTWFCHHDACQGRHKLQFLEEALRCEWFPESVLTDDAFLLPSNEDDEEEDAQADGGDSVFEGDDSRSFQEMATEFTTAASEKELRDFISAAFKAGVDMSERANITTELAARTNLRKADFNKIWNALDKEELERLQKLEAAERMKTLCTINEVGFRGQCDYTERRIKKANEPPQVFHYMESLYLIRENADRHATMREMNRDMFAHFVNTVAEFARVNGEGSTIGVSCPDDVVKHLYAADYGMGAYPPLRGLVTTPIFTRKGKLLKEPGYDSDSLLYYHKDYSLQIPKVMSEPSSEDLYEAKRLLIEEVLADFPLGAKTRPEIVSEALNGEGLAAVTNAIAMILLPFCREMIDGATPGHLLVKPAPGTGASLLTDVFSIIANGQVTPALAMPPNKEELAKTLTSVLANGQNIVFFDNINHSVDSGELASAMTAPVYQARKLGSSQTIDVDVRCCWVFTGNNVTLSTELIRRLIMLDLDAELENPENRTGFRHKDIRGWVTENRGKLVWACLTLVQNWIARGMVRQKEVSLASYENWSGVIGGILKDAGLGGFMQNRDALSDFSNDKDDELKELIQQIADEMHEVENARLYVGSTRAEERNKGRFSLLDILNSMEVVPALHNWGYTQTSDGVEYKNSRSVGRRWSLTAKRPFSVLLGSKKSTVRFEVQEDPSKKVNYYTMKVTQGGAG